MLKLDKASTLSEPKRLFSKEVALGVEPCSQPHIEPVQLSIGARGALVALSPF